MQRPRIDKLEHHNNLKKCLEHHIDNLILVQDMWHNPQRQLFSVLCSQSMPSEPRLFCHASKKPWKDPLTLHSQPTPTTMAGAWSPSGWTTRGVFEGTPTTGSDAGQLRLGCSKPLVPGPPSPAPEACMHSFPERKRGKRERLRVRQRDGEGKRARGCGGGSSSIKQTLTKCATFTGPGLQVAQ